MKTGDEEINGVFFLTFMGCEIIITTDLMNSVTSSSEMGTVTETSPVFYEGILLDEDSEYFYLGQNPGEISEAVAKSRKVAIQLKDDSKVMGEFLKQVPIEGELN